MNVVAFKVPLFALLGLPASLHRQATRIGGLKALIALLLASWISSATIIAQTPPPAPPSTSGTGVISGRITLSDKPLPNVRVHLIWIDLVRIDRIDVIARTVTDADGRYQFANLAAGVYLCLPFAPGALLPPDHEGRQRPPEITLGEGETIENADLRLTRGGVITGQVKDAGGRPVIEQKINLLRVDEQNRTSLWMDGNDEIRVTDDRGIYRIYGVPPGRYRVSVGLSPAVVVPRLNEPGRYFTQTFHPGTTNEAEAAVIDVREGSVIEGVDIRLGEAKRSYSIYGRVIDAETGTAVAGVMVGYSTYQVVGSTSSGSSSGPRSDLNGAFQISGALPGKYSVFSVAAAGSEYYSDPVPIEVTDRDVTGTDIRLKRGMSLSGEVVIEGRAESDLRELLRVIGVEADNVVQNGISRHMQASTDANGRFRISGIQPGKLYLYPSTNALMRGLLIDRIEHPAVDEAGAIEISPDAQLTGLRLVLRQTSGSIRARVKVTGGELPAGTRVDVSASRRDSQRHEYHHSSQTDVRGIILIPRLIPGDYQVIARLVPTSGSGPEWIWKIPPAVKQVTVLEGQTVEVELTLDLTQK